MHWSEKLKLVLKDTRSHAFPLNKQVSSVLVAIGWNKEKARDEILLTKRTQLVETHKGQISFPGGYRDAQDPDLCHTMLRELREEVGVQSPDVEIIGMLKPVLTLREVLIYPWVGKMSFPYPFSINPSEVERLLYLPMPLLLSEGLAPVEVEVAHGSEIHKVKSVGIYVENELIWGATARILQQIRRHFLAHL